MVDWPKRPPDGGHAVLGIISNVRREGDNLVADFKPMDSWGPRWDAPGMREPSECYPGIEGPIVISKPEKEQP